MSQTDSPCVICLGVATLDQIFVIDELPAFPAKMTARQFIVTGGGMAANAAVAVQRLGGSARYWGRVGNDLTGDQVLGLLAREGVDIAQVRRLAGHATKASGVLIDGRGERLVIRAPAQNYPPDCSWLPLSSVAQAQAVHADTRWPEGAMALFDAAAQHGIASVLDGDSGENDVTVRLSRAASHAILGESLYRQLGLGEPAQGLPQLFGGRNQICGVTCGAQGFHWFDGEALHHTPSPQVKAVDTLAAGDTFHGAYALALAQRQSPRQAAVFASATAALKCTRFGGREGIPRRAEVEAFMARAAYS